MAAAANLTKTLERAREKLTKNDDAGALDALLIAWRSRRVPRIADLIDRVSNHIMGMRTPIKAKTVKARTKKWLAMAKKRDPADLGHLLTTPLPGTWRDASPLITALLKFPDDPRIAMAIARIIDEAPFDTSTSSLFYVPLVEHLGKLLDLRTLPILEADTKREKSSHWQRTGVSEVAAINILTKTYNVGPPPLSKREEQALRLLEGMFSEVTSVERAKAKGESDFLSAIYEAPDDDALREVFADWLSERNDPRGELITLQLARHAGRFSDATLKREASLIKKYGKAWAGKLDRALDKDYRVFERGFLASGILAIEGEPKTPPKVLSDPAWATFHSLEVPWQVGDLALAIVSLPSMRWIKVFRSINEWTMAQLAKIGPRPRFEEIDLSPDVRYNTLNTEEDEASRALIAAGSAAAFPNVKRLAIDTDVDKMEWILAGALAKRVDRIALYSYYAPIGALARLVERFQLPTRELSARTNHVRKTHWLFTARRDAEGRFTKIHGEPYGLTRSIPSPNDLQRALNELGPNDLTELTIEREHVTCNYDVADIEALEACFAKFPKLTRIEVPWERVKRTATKTGEPLQLRLRGRLGEKEELLKLWPLLVDPPLSLTFDSYSLNDGKHMSLPKDGLRHALGYYEKKRSHRLRLYRKDSSDTCAVEFGIHSSSVVITSLWKGDDDSAFVDRYIEWLVRLLDTVPVDWGRLRFRLPKRVNADGDESVDTDIPTLEPLFSSSSEPVFSWVNILGPWHAANLPFEDLQKLAGTPNLEWLSVVQTQRNAIVVAGPRPQQLPNEAGLLALQLGVASVMWKRCASARGFIPHDRVLEILGPPLRKLGFEPVELDALPRALGHVLFVSRKDPTCRYGIHVEPEDPLANMSFTIYARRVPNEKAADGSSSDRALATYCAEEQWWSLPASTAKEARKSLKTFLSMHLAQSMIWFGGGDCPPEASSRRRR